MNNTKNDKYLRKNRHDKNSKHKHKHKHKHKTRKVQRGGAVEPGVTKEEQVLLLQQRAEKSNEMKKQGFPMVKELIRKFKAWFIEKFTPGTTENMRNLEEITRIEESIKSSETNQSVDGNIDKFITEFKQILTGILEERLSELQKINSSTNNDELKEKIIGIIEILDQIKKINEKNFNTESKKLFESSKEILKKPSITQRVKQGFSNMGKTVKNAATSAKNAVTSRFSRKKNINEDSEGFELQDLKNSNQEESTEKTSTEPTPADKENKTDNNEKSKTEQQEGDATNPKISMLDKGKQRLATMGAATKEGFAKMKTNVSNFFTRKKKTEDNSTELTPLAPLEPQAGGGNKTRKNRQYIREIKDNRAHLFNKEMEIINSIRNFKHGHIHEPKKQFIRAVKRG